MGFIVIDYDSLVLVVVFAFAAIGLSRGWLTEFINTVLFVILSVLLIKPEMLQPVLEKLNELTKLLVAMFKSGFDLGGALTTYKEMDHIIDPNNPYPILLVVIVALLAMQYTGTRIKLTGELTALSRILGAILGAINGNIVLSLGKELILRYTEKQVEIMAAEQSFTVQAQTQAAYSLAPSGLVLALQDAPSGFLPESSWTWIAIAVVSIGLVLLVNRFTSQSIGMQ